MGDLHNHMTIRSLPAVTELLCSCYFRRRSCHCWWCSCYCWFAAATATAGGAPATATSGGPSATAVAGGAAARATAGSAAVNAVTVTASVLEGDCAMLARNSVPILASLRGLHQCSTYGAIRLSHWSTARSCDLQISQ